MNLHEYQAKDLLRKYNLPILEGKSYIQGIEDIAVVGPIIKELKKGAYKLLIHLMML